MSKVTLETRGHYAWPPLPPPTWWERLGGRGPRRREQRVRRERERRDWLLAVHATAVLEEEPWVTSGRLIVDQGDEHLHYELFHGVLALRGAVPLDTVASWDGAAWRTWLASLLGR